MHEQECNREERIRRWLQQRKGGQRGKGTWQAHGLVDINAPRGEANICSFPLGEQLTQRNSMAMRVEKMHS